MAYTINRRYNVRREISGEGAISRVFLVDDVLEGGRSCALKLLRPLKTKDLSGARKEFETLRSLRHPLIAEVYDFGKVEEVDGAGQKKSSARPGDFFITFSYIDGLDLRKAFLRLFPDGDGTGQPQPLEEQTGERWRVFYEALAEIALGLHAIHSRGLVHHDIKPQNLLLTPRGRGEFPDRFDVKIIDLGLAQPETTPLGTRVRGTLPFVAPEVLSGAFADRRSDLYSLGISIIVAVSGELPFPDATVEEATQAIQAGNIRPLRQICPWVPLEIDEIVSRLVQHGSEQRFQDAMELVAELERIGGFSHFQHATAFRSDVPSIGWERELALLSGEIEALSIGESERSVVFIESDEGFFTSQFLAEVEAAALIQGVKCLTGRSPHPASFPYQALSEIIQKLILNIDFEGPRYKRFHEPLSVFVPNISTAVNTPRDSLESAHQRLEFFDTVTEFLLEAGREAPFILCLRDLAHCDEETLRLVEYIARNVAFRRRGFEDNMLFDDTGDGGAESGRRAVRERPTRLLILAVHEEPPPIFAGYTGESASDDRQESTQLIGDLEAQPYTLKIKLSPLGPERVGEWISHRAPGLSLSTKLIHRVCERCGGAPRLLDEIVRRLGRNQDPDEIETVRSLPRNLRDACMERLLALGSADRLLLDLLATAHFPLPILVVRRLGERMRTASLDPEVFVRLRRLVEEGFLEVFEGPNSLKVGWSLRSLEEQVYRELPEDMKVGLHHAIFEELLSEQMFNRSGLLSEELAFHARRSRQPGPFVHHAFHSAEVHWWAHSLAPALELLEEVLRLLSVSSANSEDLPDEFSREEFRWTILQELGEIYQARGELGHALEKFTVLLSLEEEEPDPVRRAKIFRKMGLVYRENKDPTNALFFLEKSLKTLENGPPGQELVKTLLALTSLHYRQGQIERAESTAERTLDSLQGLKEGSLRSKAYSMLGTIATRQNDLSRSLIMNQKAREELGSSEDLKRLAQIAAALGENHLNRGVYEKAIEEFDRGIELAEQVNSKRLLALFYNHKGTIHFNRANHFHAREFFKKSLHLRQELGDPKGIANSYNNLGLVFSIRNELSRATECYKRSIDIFARIDDQYGMAAGMNNLASILEREGKYSEALEYSFRSLDKRKRFNARSGIAYSYYRIGKIYQSKGDLDKALAYAEKSLAIRQEIDAKMGIAFSHVQLAELFLLSGKLLEAYRECQRGQEEFEKLENDLGKTMAREVLARILIQVGNLDEASEILHRVLARAREGNQQQIVGLALLDLARIAREQGKTHEAEANLSRAEELFRSNRNRREHAEVLLERCTLTLGLGNHQRASEILEDAYAILENLEIRDLVPQYFLLRARIESEVPGGSLDRARKFLERGLVESGEIHLPDLSWQLHYREAQLLYRQGEPALARDQAREAEKILAAQVDPLPSGFQEHFYQTRDRIALRELDSPAVAHPVSPGKKKTEERAPDSPSGTQVEETGSINKRLLKLQEIVQALTSELSLHKLLEKLMDSVLELVNAERGFLILRTSRSKNGGTDGDQEDQIEVARNLDREAVDNPELKISRSISAEVIRTGSPMLSTSALDDERFVDSKSVHDLRLQSIVCVPLLVREQVLGAIYLDNRLRRHAFTEDDLQVLKTFSAQAAIAITNARLSEEIQARNRELLHANRQMDVLNQGLLQKVNERTAELKVARESLGRHQSVTQRRTRFHKLVGKSKPMHKIFRILEKVANTTLPVLIAGESGTGKELIANAIHQTGARRDQRYIAENCAALSETLLESELFGHARGAFTGAVGERKGIFELAHGGTLFLDEVGEMSLSMQKKLLRVLQEGEFRRVGGKATVKIDVRIISASNQDLQALVDTKKFRADLFFRLNGILIQTPPLRERKEDIPLLVEHFVSEISRESRQPAKSLTADALRLLMSYDWPGNVRELRHFLDRTILLAPGPTIQESDCLFDPVIFQREKHSGAEELPFQMDQLPLRESRDLFVKYYLEIAFERNKNNVSRAAKAAGISRESFHRLMKKLDCKRPPRR